MMRPMAFASAQTLTATGYVNNVQPAADLGGGVPVTAAGRTEGLWCMNITAIDFASADESYKLHLLARTMWHGATATST
jgi:hypothetical protein